VVMPDINGPIETANAAGIKGGRKPTTVPPPSAASPELSPRPQRRTFSAAAKRRILAETDRAADTGGIAAILRREGLYSSALTEWRRQREAGAFEALKPLRRGPKPVVAQPADADLGQLRRENARLRQRLEHAEAIIGIQKKLQPCWGYRWRRPRATRHHDADCHRSDR
jgi:transposase